MSKGNQAPVSQPSSSAKKADVYMGPKGEPESMKKLSKFKQGTVALLGPDGQERKLSAKAKAEQPEAEKMSKPAYVISRLDHQVILSYNGDGMCVAPRGRVKVANVDLVGALPRGVFIVPAPELAEK